MPIKKHIPNFLTLCNLLCGCVAIVYAFQGNLTVCAYLVFFAALLDFLDGFVARALGAYSETGKQLDSLADMVTFGVVPGVVMFQLMNFSFILMDWVQAISPEQEFIGSQALTKIENAIIPGLHLTISQGNALSFVAFLIPVFSALRLAKFNIDPRQSDSFIGLPTPVNAILVCSIPLMAEALFGTVSKSVLSRFSALRGMFNSPDISGLELALINPVVLCVLTVILSFLLVSNLPLFALKFKNYSWKENKIRYVFLVCSAVLLAVFQFAGIPLIVFLYVILSGAGRLAAKKPA